MSTVDDGLDALGIRLAGPVGPAAARATAIGSGVEIELLAEVCRDGHGR
jgi:hypothetical protein